MAYPTIPERLSDANLREYFNLRSDDLELSKRIRHDSTRLGFLVLLKSFQYLGYPPHEKTAIPAFIVKWISAQVGLNPDLFNRYKWKNRTWDLHISIIRDHTGFRPCEADDSSELHVWLTQKTNDKPARNDLLDSAVQKCRNNQIELPSDKELLLLVNSARNSFFQDVYQKISDRLTPEIKDRMKACLKAGETDTTEYDWIKSKAGRLGMPSILEEIRKLNFIRQFNLEPEICFKGISQEALRYFKRRALPENSYQMDRHPVPICHTYISVLIYSLQQKITDNIVRSFMELIRRIEKKADKSLEKKLIKNIKKVYGKNNILYKIAKASTENPDGTVEEVVFKTVGHDILKRIVEEFDAENQGADYESSRTRIIKAKYSRHYRRMLKPVLETLRFHAKNSAYQPIIDGVDLIKKHIDKRCTYYPQDENIPDKLFTNQQAKFVYENTDTGIRVVKHYFEVYVLQKLGKALNCKEVWVEGAYMFRNPDLDLPQNWPDIQIERCEKWDIPTNAKDFIEPIRKEMIDWVNTANTFFKCEQDVYIYYPAGGSKGRFRIPKIKARPERPILQEIKDKVLHRWGMLDLLDVLVEADKHVEFSRFFHTTGQRQILSHKAIKERLILCLFGIATNLGLKRIHSATNPSCSYDDLLYFRKRFVSIEPVRAAIAALTKKILELRNPAIWGCSTAYASDGKYIGAWDQNLVAEWNPHYQKTGVMAYWHVDTNATCVYSQLKAPMSSQVAAMLKGLILHDTEMRIESNYVDSHGQSEVAFPFCRFIGVELCPRLKRMKYQRIYLPDKGMESCYKNLKGVLTRPIRWHQVYEQYGEMARHVVATLERTGPIESILRRFNSHNRNHPTYKAFVEAGKALRTIHSCKYLTQPPYRREIHEGLNIVENWNLSNAFISYGRKSEIQTNDPELQELSILCLHLMQNALIMVNTIMVEWVLTEGDTMSRMQPEDYNSLTPLFTLNINPYGYFALDFEKPSILEVF
jgi:TnpA family transposase